MTTYQFVRTLQGALSTRGTVPDVAILDSIEQLVNRFDEHMEDARMEAAMEGAEHAPIDLTEETPVPVGDGEAPF